MFDAYTVKKVLPRLVAAVVLIQLSWFIFTTMISLTNQIAFGLEALIAAPFGGLDDLSLQSIFAGFDVGGGTVSLTAIVIGGVAGKAIAGGIFAVGTFVLLALLVGYLVLAIRRVVLIALLLIAPLALVAWILPGTQRFWKLWWDNFSKLLIMFPLIIVMLTAGRALAKVMTIPGDSGIVEPAVIVLVLVCVFAPFFLIPATYKAAGAGLGFAAGWLTSQAGGLNNSARKRGGFLKEDSRKALKERAENDGLFKGGTRNNLRGRINRAVGATSAIGAGGLTLSKDKRLARMQTARGSKKFDAASQFMKENAAFSALAGDDDKLWAIMQGGSETEVARNLAARAPERFSNPAQLQAAVSEVMRARREGGDEIARIAATRAQAGTGTGFTSSGQMLDAINDVAGGDRSVAGRMLGEMRGATVQSGRADLGGAGFADMAKAMDMRRASKDGGPAFTTEDATDFVSERVLRSQAAGALLSGKKGTVEALAPKMVSNLQTAIASKDTNAINQELAVLAGRYDAMSQVAPQNAKVMADEVLSKPAFTDATGQTVTIQKMIEDRRLDPAFLSMRREYSSAQQQQALGGVQIIDPGAQGGAGGGAPGQ